MTAKLTAGASLDGEPWFRSPSLSSPPRPSILFDCASSSRLRVGRRLTPQHVAGVLTDVPQATLYRQIERLYRGGALAIAAERRVRGAVERTYVLAEGGASLSPEDLAKCSRDDHLGYFTAFAAGLIAQFEQYLERSEIDLVKDGVGYRQVVLNLTEEEIMEMAVALNAAVGRFLAYEPKPGRKRRLLATVLFPLDDDQEPS